MLPIQPGLYFFIVRNIHTGYRSIFRNRHKIDSETYATHKKTLTSRTLIFFLFMLISNCCVTVEIAKGHHSPNARLWLVEFCFFYNYTAKYQGILA